MAQHEQIHITWRRVVCIWWLIVWRGTLMSLAAGFIVGSILSALIAPEVGLWAAGLAAFAIHLVAVRMAMRKQYKEFRIAFVRMHPL